MTAVLLSITTLGFAIGLLLGILSDRLVQEEDPVTLEIEGMMPGSQCAQCGFPGCAQAAQAVVNGEASPAICPPGGAALAKRIAERLGVALDASALEGVETKIAAIGEELCIGCTKCSKVCPTDAIIGAPKQIHAVLAEYCTGCGLCVDACPTETLALRRPGEALEQWRWPKPTPQAA